MVEDEENFLHDQLQQEQQEYNEHLVARRNAEAVGNIDRMLGM